MASPPDHTTLLLVDAMAGCRSMCLNHLSEPVAVASPQRHYISVRWSCELGQGAIIYLPKHVSLVELELYVEHGGYVHTTHTLESC